MTGRMKTKNYTERALATCNIPHFVFVPRGLRPGEGRLNVKIANSDIIDNHARIANADPLGWMIAVLNGQPIPQFVIDKTSGKDELVLTYYIPSVEDRFKAAEWLGTRVTFKTPSAYKWGKPGQGSTQVHADDYQALIANAAGEKNEP